MKIVSSKTLTLENAEEASKLYSIISDWRDQEVLEPEHFQDIPRINFADELMSALVAYDDI